MSLADIIGGPPHKDYIELAGERSPGIAIVKNAGSPRDWDVRKGYGLSGSTLVFTGASLSPFDVDIFLWKNEHWAQWDKFEKATLAIPTSANDPMSLSIRHPMLNKPPISIFQCVVKNVSGWEQNEDGLWSCTISFMHYRKPKPALARPGLGAPGSPLAVQPPRNASEKIIEGKSAELKELSAELARVSVPR